MQNWMASGPDMIHAYWLKKLSSLHEHLAAQISHVIMDETHPGWLVDGSWTVLILKDPHKGAVPSTTGQ